MAIVYAVYLPAALAGFVIGGYLLLNSGVM
jgi:hypothetical protein